jgi:voltage-gated potassium channel
MPIFLVFTRLFKSVSRYRVRALVALAVAILLVGAALFSVTQGVDYGTALYWAITTATTVGYGDVLPHDTFGRVLASVVMLTTIPIVGTIFGLVAGASAVSHIRRILGMDAHLPTQPYTLVVGLDPVVPRVLEELCRGDSPTVLVAPSRPPGIPDDVVFVGGDITDEEVLARAQPGRADRALIACVEDADTMVVAVALHGMAPTLKKYALTQSPRVARALRELGVKHTLSSEELVGHTVAKALETPEAGDLLLQLVDATGYRLEEQIVDAAMASQPLSRARNLPGTLVLGIARDGTVDLGVGDDPALTVGDRLIVLHQGP